jgi:hypothetical protein
MNNDSDIITEEDIIRMVQESVKKTTELNRLLRNGTWKPSENIHILANE